MNNDPVNNIDPTGLANMKMCEDGGAESYLDYNFGFGLAGIGVTVGLQAAPSGNYFYIGGGVMTPGPSMSITAGKDQSPSPGFNVGVGGGAGGVIQVGKGPDGPFYEIGLGSPGASGAGFWVFEPFD